MKIGAGGCTMPRVELHERVRGVSGFAIGNFVPAVVLGVGLYALPVRFWPVDAAVVLALIGVMVGSGVALAHPAFSLRALRVAALALLGIGLLLVGVAGKRIVLGRLRPEEMEKLSDNLRPTIVSLLFFLTVFRTQFNSTFLGALALLLFSRKTVRTPFESSFMIRWNTSSVK